MSLLIDTANIDEIRKAFEVFPLDGVTTCPSIITRENRNFWEILSDIRKVIGNGAMLHAQVIGRTTEEMYRDAMTLVEHSSGNFFVKVPVTIEGLKLMRILKNEGIAFTATTIHTVSQAILAAEQGACYIAPYINHIEDAGISGEDFISQVAAYIEGHQLETQILAASFRNVKQITEVLIAGANTITASPDLIWKMADSALTDQSVAKFRKAWDGCYGANKNIYNL